VTLTAVLQHTTGCGHNRRCLAMLLLPCMLMAPSKIHACTLQQHVGQHITTGWKCILKRAADKASQRHAPEHDAHKHQQPAADEVRRVGSNPCCCRRQCPRGLWLRWLGLCCLCRDRRLHCSRVGALSGEGCEQQVHGTLLQLLSGRVRKWCACAGLHGDDARGDSCCCWAVWWRQVLLHLARTCCAQQAGLEGFRVDSSSCFDSGS
jgi:hypothetical protein